ncbi:hypothetical protein G3N74_10700, partial [Xanthomonas hortorum pv. gardneri]
MQRGCNGRRRSDRTPANNTPVFHPHNCHPRRRATCLPIERTATDAMLRALIDLKPRDVPLRVALRNTAAVVLPLAVGVATGHVAAGLAVCTGALNT